MENGAGSKSAACRALGLARSGLYRQAKSSVEGRRIRKEVLIAPMVGGDRVYDASQPVPLPAEDTAALRALADMLVNRGF